MWFSWAGENSFLKSDEQQMTISRFPENSGIGIHMYTDYTPEGEYAKWKSLWQ